MQPPDRSEAEAGVLTGTHGQAEFQLVLYSRVMARPTEWRRFPLAYAELATAPKNVYKIQLQDLLDGETLTRTYVTWQATHAGTTSADGSGFVVCAGVIVVPQGTAEASVPAPYSSPDTDWQYWEAAVMQPIWSRGGTSDNEIDCAPQRPAIRSSRGQRGPAPSAGLDVWFVTEDDGISIGQSEYYLSFSVEQLVLLPA